MQFWAPNSKAFIDPLDGFVSFPFSHSLISIEPDTLLNPPILSILLHEYTHHVSFSGPMSFLSAFYTSVTFIAREICVLKAEDDPSDFLSRFRPIGGYETNLDIAALGFADLFSPYIRFYTNFLQSYRWAFEGLALFIQWDYLPSSQYSSSTPLSRFIAKIQKVGHHSTPEAQDSIEQIWINIRESEKKLQKKWMLYEPSAKLLRTTPNHRDYFVGYILVKRIWHLVSALDIRLRETDLFLRFLLNFLFHDWGIINLCKPIAEDLEDGEPEIQDTILTFQRRSLQAFLTMDKDYVKNHVDLLIQSATSNLYNVSNPSALPYSSDPNYQISAPFNIETINEDVKRRIIDTAGHMFARLFGSNVNKRSSELKQIIVDGLALFDLLRLHHAIFKINEDVCVLIGYQTMNEDVVRGLFAFDKNGQQRWIANSFPKGSLMGLVDLLKRDGFSLIEFPSGNLDLSKAHSIGEGELVNLYKSLPNKAIIEIYDLFDPLNAQWIHMRRYKDQVLLMNVSEQNNQVDREDEFIMLAKDISRENYWERVKFAEPRLPDGTNVYMLFLDGVDDYRATEKTFDNKILKQAWRVLFPQSMLKDRDLNDIWDGRFGGGWPTASVLVRSDEMKELCQVFCEESNQTVGTLEVAVHSKVKFLNDQWAKRVGTELIRETNIEKENMVGLTWLY